MSAQDPVWLKTKAEAGDGVLSLLRRFELSPYSCNVEQFYRINQMEKTDGLFQGKEYLLPVRKHLYNRRSIRSTIGITDFDLAVRIQDYNRAMQKKGFRTRAYEDDLDLWVPHHLLHCPDEADETRLIAEQETRTGNAGIFPIFGPKYQKVEPVSTELKGQVFYISAGHGGPDPGAMSTRAGHTLCEDEYAYDVSLRLCRHLIAKGAIAYMIIRDNNDGIRDEPFLVCDTDEVALGEKTIPLNQKERLYQRAKIINQLYERHKQQGVRKQTSLFIHVDYTNQGLRQDVFFYHLKSSKAGKALAETLQETFREKYMQHQASRSYHGTVSGRDLYVLRETSPVGVYIELANIRNPEDQRRIVLRENREALAKWLAEGLVKGNNR
jgi:N-acetylmuramoyl-L-alanine amidase